MNAHCITSLILNKSLSQRIMRVMEQPKVLEEEAKKTVGILLVSLGS